MSLARVVAFEGVSRARMEELSRELREEERPEGLPAAEMIGLYDPAAEKALAIVFFETEDEYRRGDETLNAMPSDETPGSRSSVSKYEVAIRRSF